MKKIILLLSMGLFLLACDDEIVDIQRSNNNFKILSPMTYEVNASSDYFDIIGTCDAGADAIRVAVDQDSTPWIRCYTEDSVTDTFKVQIYYDTNQDKGPRVGKVNFFAKDCLKMESVTIHQDVGKFLAFTENRMNVGAEGGTFQLPLKCNVKFKSSFREAGSWKEVEYPWVVLNEPDENGNVTVTVSPSDVPVRRIKMYLEEIVENEDDWTHNDDILLVQHTPEALLYSSSMMGTRLMPKWEEQLLPEYIDNCTFEVLFMYDTWRDWLKQPLLGVKDEFQLYFINNKLELNQQGQVTIFEDTYTDKQWCHLALTIEEKVVTVYIDGRIVGTAKLVGKGIPFVRLWSEYSPDNEGKLFCYGWEPGTDRGFVGEMTELRVWTKPLTQEEINAPKHFYYVDPASNDLLFYWKLTAGEGDIVENASLSYPADVPLVGGLDSGGIDWVYPTYPQN